MKTPLKTRTMPIAHYEQIDSEKFNIFYSNGSKEITYTTREQLDETLYDQARALTKISDMLNQAITNKVIACSWLVASTFAIISKDFSDIAIVLYITNFALQYGLSIVALKRVIAKPFPTMYDLVSTKREIKKMQLYFRNETLFEEFNKEYLENEDNFVDEEFDGTLNTIDKVSLRKLNNIVRSRGGRL